MFLTLHRFGDGKVNNQFPANALNPLFLGSLGKVIKVGSHQLWVKSGAESNIAVERSVGSHCSTHENGSPVMIVAAQEP